MSSFTTHCAQSLPVAPRALVPAALLCFAMALPLAAPAGADNHGELPEVTTTALTGTLHLLQGRRRQRGRLGGGRWPADH